jgi:hypothetical protein
MLRIREEVVGDYPFPLIFEEYVDYCGNRQRSRRIGHSRISNCKDLRDRMNLVLCLPVCFIKAYSLSVLAGRIRESGNLESSFRL